ncbi:uncharacterized protein LOC122510747 [Leptopilina heterotoma]|uniref:uncharacterized protein LOC122510747 n=1 Tax=Leptopilina heterotoma TaxID=63436 RepID=UPI001CAA1E8A|nr:uncharacterized protein LOC122510747 [Leptopilina heterotoma]
MNFKEMLSGLYAFFIILSGYNSNKKNVPEIKQEFKNTTAQPKHKLFKNHLELAIDYFEKVLKLDDCNRFPMYNNSKNVEFNFQKIVNLLTRTAMENYSLNKNYYPESLSFPKIISEEMQKLMHLECVPGLNENKETLKSLCQFFDFLKVFSTENVYGKKRYFKNIVELKLINIKIQEFVSKKYNVSRETLNTRIKEGIQNLSNCLNPKAI